MEEACKEQLSSCCVERSVSGAVVTLIEHFRDEIRELSVMRDER